MTAKSETVGRPIVWNGSHWVYEDTDKRIPEDDADLLYLSRPCPHCGEKPVGVRVKVSAKDSHTGKAYWKVAGIDHCIASIVEVLQQAKIYTRGCCCGHGKGKGNIILQDGRTLIIKKDGNKCLAKR